jgi:hypothetical protein
MIKGIQLLKNLEAAILYWNNGRRPEHWHTRDVARLWNIEHGIFHHLLASGRDTQRQWITAEYNRVKNDPTYVPHNLERHPHDDIEYPDQRNRAFDNSLGSQPWSGRPITSGSMDSIESGPISLTKKKPELKPQVYDNQFELSDGKSKFIQKFKEASAVKEKPKNFKEIEDMNQLINQLHRQVNEVRRNVKSNPLLDEDPKFKPLPDDLRSQDHYRTWRNRIRQEQDNNAARAILAIYREAGLTVDHRRGRILKGDQMLNLPYYGDPDLIDLAGAAEPFADMTPPKRRSIPASVYKDRSESMYSDQPIRPPTYETEGGWGAALADGHNTKVESLPDGLDLPETRHLIFGSNSSEAPDLPAKFAIDRVTKIAHSISDGRYTSPSTSYQSEVYEDYLDEDVPSKAKNKTVGDNIRDPDTVYNPISIKDILSTNYMNSEGRAVRYNTPASQTQRDNDNIGSVQQIHESQRPLSYDPLIASTVTEKAKRIVREMVEKIPNIVDSADKITVDKPSKLDRKTYVSEYKKMKKIKF